MLERHAQHKHKKQKTQDFWSHFYKYEALLPPQSRLELRSKFATSYGRDLEEDFDTISIPEPESALQDCRNLFEQSRNVIIDILVAMMEQGTDGTYDGLERLRLLDKTTHAVVKTSTALLGLDAICKPHTSTLKTRSLYVEHHFRMKWRQLHPSDHIPYCTLTPHERKFYNIASSVLRSVHTKNARMMDVWLLLMKGFASDTAVGHPIQR